MTPTEGTTDGVAVARRRPRRRRRLVVVALVVAALVVLDLRLLVFPRVDQPHRADAIVVYAGPGDRIDRAWELADRGVADHVVVSIADTSDCEQERPTVEQICFTPDPATTRGEAEAVARLAQRRGWDDLIIVSGTTQVTRIRLRQGRCFDGRVKVVAVREPLGDFLYRWVYEHGALVKALVFQRAC
jgi:hypothetical protein